MALTIAAASTQAMGAALATNIGAAATKGDQTTAPGSWSMAWSVGDLNVAGVFSAELETTWPGGGIRTFGPVSFRVDPQLA